MKQSLCIFLAIALGCTSAKVMPSAAPKLLATASPTTLPSQVFNFDEMKAQKTSSGERRTVFQQETATLNELEVHITTLDPGQQAHPPHRHPHEEMMFLKEGTLEAFVNGQHIPMPTGSVLFLAPMDLHNVKNVGTTRATYFVVTWKTPKTAPATQPAR
jgi:XRE family transcriptional regulator, regulator of sulfur utilization